MRLITMCLQVRRVAAFVHKKRVLCIVPLNFECSESGYTDLTISVLGE